MNPSHPVADTLPTCLGCTPLAATIALDIPSTRYTRHACPFTAQTSHNTCVILLPATLQTRSSAIEQVQRGLLDLSPNATQQLLQQLPQFVAFLLQLLQDHNFKVVAAGLEVLADAARHLGAPLSPHTRWACTLLYADWPAQHSMRLQLTDSTLLNSDKLLPTAQLSVIPNDASGAVQDRSLMLQQNTCAMSPPATAPVPCCAHVPCLHACAA